MSEPMKGVLLIGSRGLLGTSLTRAWLGSPSLRVVESPRFDICSESEIVTALSSLKVHAVVNLAAMTSVDECELYPERALVTNGIAPGMIARACRERGLDFVQISTDHVYDAPGANSEGAVILRNMYAESKFAGDQLVVEAGGTVLRTNFFGPSLVPGRKSFSDWLLDSFRDRAQISLATDVFFSPLHMRTLARALARVIARPQSGIFNLGASTVLSKRDFAYVLAELKGHNLTSHSHDILIDELKLKAPRPKGMGMDNALFAGTFGLTLPTLQEEIGLLGEAHEAQV